MEIIVLIFLFYILHIDFLSRHILTGETDYVFLGYQLSYPYAYDIALKSLVFVLLNLFVLLIGYYIGSKKKRHFVCEKQIIGNSLVNLTVFLFSFQIVLFLYIIIIGGANFGDMTEEMSEVSFFVQFRFISMILLTFILYNSDIKTLKSRYKFLCILICVYIVLIFIVQTRSIILEILGILSIYWMRIKKLKVRIKYVLYLYIASIIPNLVVVFRMDYSLHDFSNIELYKNLLSYEYTLLFNNILSEVMMITEYPGFDFDKTIIFNNLGVLLIPSFLRNLLPVTIEYSKLDTIAHNADVVGGGFSLLAELYLYCGYFSLLYFLFVGIYIGSGFRKIYSKQYLSLTDCAVPLLYIYFLISFRNSAESFLKQFVQIYIVIYFIKLLISASKVRKNLKIEDQPQKQ